MPPPAGCPTRGTPSPEVTGSICRVPSTPFSQAPWYALPVHLCRFRVRSIRWGYFLERLRCTHNPVSTYNLRPSSTPSRPRNINLVPIDYGFRPRLRGRLTLRGLALRRNPWTFGDRVSHSVLATHVSILASDTSRGPHGPPSRAYGTLRYRVSHPEGCDTPAASVHGFSPVTSSAQAGLTRPVSCYAFFKGWLLLSQPPGCLGRPTSFPT